MLVQFSIKNYRSFYETATLSVVASNLVSRDKELDENNTLSVSGVNLLKSVAVYGANAGGKSNLIKALRFVRRLVLNSSKESQADDEINVEPFRLMPGAEEESSTFEIIFIVNEQRYRYGFEVNKRCVLAEWLYYTPSKREHKLFERESGTPINISNSFEEGKGLEARTRDNALFVSVCAQFNGKVSKTVLTWFRRLIILSGYDDDALYLTRTLNSITTDARREQIASFIRKLDTGIDNLHIESSEGFVPPRGISQEDALNMFSDDFRKKLLEVSNNVGYTEHRRYNAEGEAVDAINFNLSTDESEGTKKLVAFAHPILDALERGRVLVIDELDVKLHHRITSFLIDQFNSSQSNSKGAQLIFTTHDVGLLTPTTFRRDQIWFVEKNRYGSSSLYSLADYKLGNRRIRNDASYGKDYLDGRYGAIPLIGSAPLELVGWGGDAE